MIKVSPSAQKKVSQLMQEEKKTVQAHVWFAIVGFATIGFGAHIAPGKFRNHVCM